ncbi:MAG: hypothetical protein A2X36_08735 [Elusimicrobia bacterium GWA2_69_24]|nr:MAG: hypothetical protein A2X36_08735 [Elusimicrobia bacterium GWA2_69_24]HBL15863.1 hypothetical protein [Elusimicrobiota bacterium]
MPLRAPKGFIDETDPKVCQIGHPAPPWLVNYADLMTELVCFFVILYALSAALNKNVQNARAEIEKMMEKENMAGEVKIDKEGLKVSLEEQGQMSQFRSGFSELTPSMKETLDKLAPILRKLADQNHEVFVEGHTDDIPIHNDYFWSNWELSAARATTVVEYMIRDRGFPAGCMGAVGYGDQRPLAPNDSEANRQRNRRVVFFVKSTTMGKDKCSERKTRGGSGAAVPGAAALPGAPPAAVAEKRPPAEGETAAGAGMEPRTGGVGE